MQNILNISYTPVFNALMSMTYQNDAIKGFGKFMGTPFSGPPFLQFGVSKKQIALFSLRTHVPRTEI